MRRAASRLGTAERRRLADTARKKSLDSTLFFCSVTAPIAVSRWSKNYKKQLKKAAKSIPGGKQVVQAVSATVPLLHDAAEKVDIAVLRCKGAIPEVRATVRNTNYLREA